MRNVGSDTPISDTAMNKRGQRRAALQRRVDAHGDADDQREQRRDGGELQRRGHALADQRLDRRAELVGDAEIEVRRRAAR